MRQRLNQSPEGRTRQQQPLQEQVPALPGGRQRGQPPPVLRPHTAKVQQEHDAEGCSEEQTEPCPDHDAPPVAAMRSARRTGWLSTAMARPMTSTHAWDRLLARTATLPVAR